MKIWVAVIFILSFISPLFVLDNDGNHRISNARNKIIQMDQPKTNDIQTNHQPKELPPGIATNQSFQSKKESKEKRGMDSDEQNPDLCSEFIVMIFKGIYEWSSLVRFADFPYSSDHYFNTLALDEESTNGRPYYLRLTFDNAYLFDSVYGATPRMSGNIGGLHFNFSYQGLYSGDETLNFTSLNLGLTVSIENFLLNGYIGAGKYDFLDNLYFSGGVSATLFLPAGFFIDYYSLYSLYHQSHTGTLNYSLNRFTIGLGYTYSDYAGIIFQGPVVSISCWL